MNKQPIFKNFSNLDSAVDNVKDAYCDLIISPTKEKLMSIGKEAARKLHMEFDDNFAQKYFSVAIPERYAENMFTVYDPIIGIYQTVNLMREE